MTYLPARLSEHRKQTGVRIAAIMQVPFRGANSGMSAGARLGFWKRLGVYRSVPTGEYPAARVAALLRAAHKTSGRVEIREW